MSAVSTSPSAASAPVSMWTPLRGKNFRRFFLSAIVSNAGSWMQSVAVPFTVYEITDSESWLGISAFIGLFASMLANAPGGMLADRYPRRVVLACTQAIQMVSALSLWALWTYGSPSIATMLPLLTIGSVGGGLSMPVWQSLLPSLVQPHEVSAAIRLNSVQFAVARSVGPLLGAFTLKVFGASVCFMANAVTYPAIIGVLMIVPDAGPRVGATAERVALGFRQAFGDVVEGWRYLRTKPGLRYAPMAVFINAAFGFGLTTLAPAFARDLFQHSADDNGMLIGAFGIGGVVGVVGIGVLAKHSAHSRQVRVGFTAFALAAAGLAVTRNFWVGLALFALAGCANTSGATALNTSVQSQVDDSYRGRVMGIYMQMFFLGSALGSMALGVLADVVSLKAAAAASSAVFVGFHVWSYRRYDKLRVLDHAVTDSVTDAAAR